VETRTGLVLPACFENLARSPDEIVRRILVSVSSYNLNIQGKILDIYDTRRDIFTIPCVKWYKFLIIIFKDLAIFMIDFLIRYYFLVLQPV
jgi:Protein N-terminal asparagine amidohydrolase